MSRVHPIYPSFTTGEVSPLLYGRTDFAKYASGARTLLNYLIRPQGPVVRRPGTHWVAEVKDSTKATRLIPFEFSTSQAYVIEAGDLYFRFYKDGGRIESPPGTPVEVASPYPSTALAQVKYVQSADTMYLVHPDYAPHKLTRQSHTAWTLAPVNFLPPPTWEAGFQSTGTLTLGATSGLAVAITLSVGDLLASDVGRMITAGTGRGIIKTVTAPTTGTVDIVDTFASVGPIASGSWTLEGSPNTSLTPGASQPTHAVTTLTLTAAGWRSTDVGRYVRVNRGVAKIIKFVSATVVDAELLTSLANVTASPGGSWSVENATWSATRGYPRAVAFFEQRLVFGGSNAQPQAFWGSNVGEYEVFALGSDDDDAYEFLIAANQVNTINWILPSRAMLLGTASGEFSVSASAGLGNASVGPNNVDVKASTFWGSSQTVLPSRIGNAAMFVTRTGTELREMVFSIERDSYIANDMLLLAEHLTEAATVVDLAYQRHPNSTVWCILSNGVALALAYQREHDVVGWSRNITGPDVPAVTPVKGKFEAVAVIPHWNGDRDVAWVVVNRTVNGAVKRFVEYFDDINGRVSATGEDLPLGMDCALVYDGAATNSVTGLTHLNGETVIIVGDGAVYPSQVVTGGAVTLDGLSASHVTVGLEFWSMLVPMRPEVPVQGTSQGLKKHWAEIIVRCNKTVGMFINGEEKAFRSASDLMDTAVPLFTGDVVHKNIGRDADGLITIEQRQPLPQTIVAIFGTMAVGE